LHYDFRLELNGVLVSWAVPKGPSLDPADRRLAMHVEDHPVEYFDFEGGIPRGQYGGGTVMVWDWGGVRWLSPHRSGSGAPAEADDPAAMLARGDLKFELYGRKLKGEYAIVRSSKDEKAWFLIKKRDEAAAPGYDVTEQDRSVLSGRTLAEIAAGAERTWHSDRPASGQGGGATAFLDLAKARPAAFPAELAPMLATPATAAFDDPDWSYEIKLDGFRTIALVRDGKVRLLSRRGLDATRQYPELLTLAILTRAADAVLDGEVVALDDEGRPSFGRLQERTGSWVRTRGGPVARGEPGAEPHPAIPIVFYVFDVLHHDGRSLQGVPLRDRRRLLEAILLDGPNVRRLEAFGGADGTLLFQAVKAQGQEGVVAKRLDSVYRPGTRSRHWLKIKANREQACAVVGYTPPQGGRKHFGSLALAVLTGEDLTYCGQVGSGFDEKLLASVMASLKPLEAGATPPANAALAPRETTWVRPALFCEVKFNEWTREGLLRQATLLRIRDDLTLEDCRREPGPA
ncbi:MAG TPA: non-homologous end-joining DNA ligase, partial [Candidatus Dormibacteraeota bacterium]|nr:non-homologous end-joining DNA ligase [Candidatus Dormibacteraeota bacterium]